MTDAVEVEIHRHLAIIHALSIEVRTGMRHSRGSVLAVVRRDYDYPGRTKRGALRHMVQLARQRFGYEPTARVTEAMGKG